MPNFYLVQLKPFNDRNDIRIPAFQAESIKLGLCGMGWGELNEYFNGKDDPYYLNSDDRFNKDTGYAKSWLKKDGKNTSNTNGINTALGCYLEMEIGDYVLTRLYETGQCYIGKIESKAYHSNNYKFEREEDNSRYSFAVKVEWKEIGSFSTIPNALRGLFQTSRQPTIKRISAEYDIARRIIVSRFENDDKKIQLKEENFSQSLDALDLEDLVGHYILNQHEGYKFIPSSCKDSEPTIEFTLFKEGKYITCQVKNKSAIDLNPLNEIADQYEIIYVFSGINKYDNDSKTEKNITAIRQHDLFEFLKQDFQNEGYFYHVLNKYYYF